MHFKSKIARLGGIIGAALLTAISGALFAAGCGGGSSGGGNSSSNGTMLILGSTSQPEYSALLGTYRAVQATGTSDDPAKHRLVAVGCNTFAPDDLAKNLTIRRAFAEKVPVTFFDMTEAHKKALMLPRMGVATPGTSPAVTLIPGKYASVTEPGIIIESKTLIANNKTDTDLSLKTPVAGKATADKSADRAAGNAESLPVAADPQWYAAKVREIIENRGLTRQIGDDSGDGAYTPPTGSKYFKVVLVGGGAPTLTNAKKPDDKNTQKMSFAVAWTIYVFDDVDSNAKTRARKILLTTVGQSQAKTSPHWANDTNGVGDDSDVGYWLGRVNQSTVLRTDNADDDTLDLVTSSPNTTQKTTSYTTSVGATIGIEIGGDGGKPTGSFTIGSSTTTDVLKWVVLQTLASTPLNNHLRNSVSHTWMQNDPFNLLTSGGAYSPGPYNYFRFSYKHMTDLPDYSNGNASLYTKSAAIYQAAPNAGIVEINPVFMASMYRYHETGDHNPHTEEQDFVYSPGVLQINTDAVDNNVQIQSITWDSAQNGIWLVPFDSGSPNGATVTVRLNQAVAADTYVTMAHYTDPNTTTTYGGPIGVTFTPGVVEPDGTTTQVKIGANTSFGSAKISATAATAQNNPQAIPFFAFMVGSVNGASGEEITSKVQIVPLRLP